MSALTIRNLSKSFGGVQALEGVSFTVEPGERRAVIGPNGAGKTTLFHTISGTFLPTTGSVMMFDQDITRLAPDRRARLGLARTFQITNLFSRLTVLENLLLAVAGATGEGAGLVRPMTAYRHLFAKAEGLIDGWDLGASAHRTVKELSYGEQRQVELLMALAGAPKVLLLDEPTAGLSPAETSRVVTMVRNLPRETTILMIEHDMDVAFELTDRVAVMHQGQLIVDGDQETVRASPQVRDIYLGEE